MTSSPTTLTARTPDDLLAVVPVVLGFHPEDSIVMLTFGPTPFHARLDLPRTAADTDDAVTQLLDPARHHGARAVAFVVYADDRAVTAARRTARALLRRFALAGIRVIDVLRADGKRWHSLHPDHRGVPKHGVPYDVSRHPFVAQAVYEGRAVLASRAELAASLRPDPGGVAAVAVALADATAYDLSQCLHAVGDGVYAGRLSDDRLASLLLAMRDPRLREAAWLLLDRAEADEHVRFWTDAVQRAPDEVVGAAAAVLALAAWVAGQGALAWCAVDRCREVDPDHELAQLVSEVLEAAIRPTLWEAIRADVFGLDEGDDGERDRD